jgi:uncharacterized delta-60 repeat protein
MGLIIIKKWRKPVFIFLLIIVSGSALSSVSGTPNSAFIANIGTGFNFEVRAVRSQPDGKILVGGAFDSFNGTSTVRIARLNADGTLDNTFNTGTGFNGSVNSVDVQPDGKILVGGVFTSFNGTSTVRIARLNADGTLDNTFNTGTGFMGVVYSADVQPDGKILVGGSFISFNGTSTVNRIARLNADGTLDNTFTTGTGFNTTVNSVDVQPDGKILVGGIFTSFNGTSTVNRIARLNTNGALDNTFNTGTGFNDEVISVDVQPDGKILVGGFFSSFNGTSTVNRIARLNADGTLDNTFNTGTGFNNTVNSVYVQPDGKILVGGVFTSFNGTNDVNRIAQLNANGTLDAAFTTNTGAGLSNSVWNDAVDIQAGTGNILVGGIFTRTNNISSNAITSFLNNAISPSSQTVNATVGTAITPTTAYAPERFYGNCLVFGKSDASSRVGY